MLFIIGKKKGEIGRDMFEGLESGWWSRGEALVNRQKRESSKDSRRMSSRSQFAVIFITLNFLITQLLLLYNFFVDIFY